MLKVLSTNKGMSGYITAARLSPASPLEPLWEKHVIEPYWSQWAAGQHNEARLREDLKKPIHDLDGLEKIIHILDTEPLEDIIHCAFERICTYLPYHSMEEDTVICLMAGDPENHILVEQLNGVVGTCVGANTLLTIHPGGEDWQKMAGYVLAHERHHSAWGYHHFYLKPLPNFTFLASLINEGSADSFASLLFPGVRPQWTCALSPEQEESQWLTMKDLLGQPDFDGALYRRFFFGDPGTATPPYTAYTIGFHLVQSYLRRHPSESVAEWTTCPPEVIYDESGYQGQALSL